MPKTHSKIAVALTEALLKDARAERLGKEGEPATAADLIAKTIDERLADIRWHYKPEEFARCPVVSHHGKPPCQFCVTAAMREFILLPEEL